MSVSDLTEISVMLGMSQQAMGVIILKIWEMACIMLCRFSILFPFQKQIIAVLYKRTEFTSSDI